MPLALELDAAVAAVEGGGDPAGDQLEWDVAVLRAHVGQVLEPRGLDRIEQPANLHPPRGLPGVGLVMLGASGVSSLFICLRFAPP